MTAADEIRYALARSCQLLEDRRYDDWTRTFTEDGVFEAYSSEWDGFGERAGRAAILKWILGAELASLPDLNRCFALVNMAIDEDGDRAGVTSDVVMLSQYGSEPWGMRVGRYIDTLVRQDSQWLIARRRLEWRQGNRLVDVQKAGVAPTIKPLA